MTSLAVNMNDHALAVDIGDLQVTQSDRRSRSRSRGHQHGAMHQVPSRINQPSNLFRLSTVGSFRGHLETESHRAGMVAEGS